MIERTGDRRQRAISLAWPERRSGFDRRNMAAVRVLRDNPTLLLSMLIVLNVLNIADWRLTAFELSAGALEANPVMATMFGIGPAAAGVFKIGLMLLVSAIVWAGRRYRRVLEFATLALMVYGALIVYHIFAITFVLPLGR